MYGCCLIAQFCPTICNPMVCSTPGFPVLHHFPNLAKTHVHWVSDVIQLPHLFPFSFFQSFWVSGSFVMALRIGGQSIGASASASVPPMNIQSWFPLGLAGLISLQSKGLSKVFSNTTVWKHQFFGYQHSLWSSSHICTLLLEKTITLTMRTIFSSDVSAF